MSGKSPAKVLVRTVCGIVLFGGISSLLAPNLLSEHGVGVETSLADRSETAEAEAYGDNAKSAAQTVENVVVEEFASLALPAGRLGASPEATELPEVALKAYAKAGIILGYSDRTCKLAPEVLAAMARVETDHGRAAQATPNDDGDYAPRVIGERLDGTDGRAKVYDTDDGERDNDAEYDHPVGPFQFLPAKWVVYGRDATSDNTADPNNVFDAALTAGTFLCSGEDDLSESRALHAALVRYRSSTDYANLVVRVSKAYAPVFEKLRNDAVKSPLVETSKQDSVQVHAPVSNAKPSRPQRPAPQKPAPQKKPTAKPAPKPVTPEPGDTETGKPSTPTPQPEPSSTTEPSPGESSTTQPSGSAPADPTEAKPSSKPSTSTSASPNPSESAMPQPSSTAKPKPSATPKPAPTSTSAKPTPTPAPTDTGATTQPHKNAEPTVRHEKTTIWDFIPKWPGR